MNNEGLNLENSNEVGTALLSVKGKKGYPHLRPIKYFKKADKIYISSEDNIVNLKEIEYDVQVSYSLIGYEQIIPMRLEDSPECLFIIEFNTNVMDPKMREDFNIFINKFAEGRIEVGVGYIEPYEDYENIIVIHIEENSKEELVVRDSLE